MNKITMTVTSIAAGAALVLGGAVAANAATPTSATPTTATPTSATSTSTAATTTTTANATSCTFGEHLLSAFRGTPKSVRDDLKKARAEAPGATRRADLTAIRTKALDGGYGAKVEADAKFLQSHKGDLAAIRPLPAKLKADLKTLRGETTRDAKVSEADTIATRALDGDYRTQVQTLAKDLQASSAWQDCTPAKSGS